MSKGKILVTGKRIEPDYNRTLIILNGLRNLGYEVLIYNYEKENRETAEAINELSLGCFFTFLPSFSHKSTRFIKKYSQAPIVFDPLISKFMTNVMDYKKYPALSYGGLRTTYRDKSSTSRADFVIFDTKEHQKYFIDRYDIGGEKTGVVYVGANSIDFKKLPPKTSEKEFVIGFIGHFIPLHGIFNILEAALQLQENTSLTFKLIGTGFDFEKAREFCSKHNIGNVEFLGEVEYQELNDYINTFDLCLGIFGDNIKSYHVIPNKIFNYASCGKPILTMESPAIQEVFTHLENIYLCPPNSKGIAEAIGELFANKALRLKLGENVFETVNENYNEEDIADSLVKQFIEFRDGAQV